LFKIFFYFMKHNFFDRINCLHSFLKKMILSPLLLLGILSVQAQNNFIVRAVDCQGNRISVPFTVWNPPPSGSGSSGTTSTTGDVTACACAVGAGTYTVSLSDGTPSSPVSFSHTNITGGGNTNAFFVVPHASKPEFMINGLMSSASKYGPFRSVWRCSTGTATLSNLSTRTSLIAGYRITVLNATNTGGTITPSTQVSQTAWSPTFPTTLNLPVAAGQFLVVRLELQNACLETSPRRFDFPIKLNSGTAPLTFNVLVNNQTNCANNSPSVSISNNAVAPLTAPRMRPGQGGVDTKTGTNFLRNRFVIQECTTTGVLVGTVLKDVTFYNVSEQDIPLRSFLDIFGGLNAPWHTNYGPTMPDKTYRMLLYLESPCGWTSPLTHYFKINRTCWGPWGMPVNPNDGFEVEEATQAIAEERGDSETGVPNPIIAPNPVTDVLQFMYDDPELLGLTVRFEVFDLTGRSIQSSKWTQTGTPQAIDVSTLTSGMYVFKCKIGETDIQGRFIKQ
jgi:hypothetical protein